MARLLRRLIDEGVHLQLETKDACNLHARIRFETWDVTRDSSGTPDALCRGLTVPRGILHKVDLQCFDCSRLSPT